MECCLHLHSVRFGSCFLFVQSGCFINTGHFSEVLQKNIVEVGRLKNLWYHQRRAIYDHQLRIIGNELTLFIHLILIKAACITRKEKKLPKYQGE